MIYEIKLLLDDGNELISNFSTFEEVVEFVLDKQTRAQVMEIRLNESCDNNRSTLRG